ncbi:hypothetical protein [Microbacterium azadirachtae]|jgi:uncharacterized protein YdhG (YjbR/CyaY superfamily)|uniref:hypothetical protein n=1 Tax=Microbacterium azadirachtae TaxID=582680 RepID=UPI003F755626
MTENTAPVLTDFERAAVKEAAKESRTRVARKKASPEELRAAGEADVQAKIAEMDEEDGSLATALHRLVAENAPHLVPKTYYGMPAWANAAGKVVCFFKPKAKFKVRYATFEFEWPAQLDDGTVWPVSYAVTALRPADLAFLGERIRTAAPAE